MWPRFFAWKQWILYSSVYCYWTHYVINNCSCRVIWLQGSYHWDPRSRSLTRTSVKLRRILSTTSSSAPRRWRKGVSTTTIQLSDLYDYCFCCRFWLPLVGFSTGLSFIIFRCTLKVNYGLCAITYATYCALRTFSWPREIIIGAALENEAFYIKFPFHKIDVLLEKLNDRIQQRWNHEGFYFSFCEILEF